MKLNPIKQKVYKVVKRIERDLESCVAQGEWCLKYVPKKLTKPLVGKIFAFESLLDAQNFVKKERNFSLEIWEAEAYSVSVGEIRAFTNANFLDVWHKINKGWADMPFVFAPVPKGTLFCKSIKLLQEYYECNQPH